MLASLLPGYRDVRSALVAGYMWVIAAWLLVSYFLPPGAQADVVGKPILQVLSVAGSAGSLVALSVLCLLIGEFTGSSTQALFFYLSKRYLEELTPQTAHDGLSGPIRVFRPMSARARRRVYNTTVKRVQKERAAANSAEPESVARLSPEDVALAALGEVLFLSPRLIVAKPELYSEFDRVRAESEFRDAILIPLPLLSVGIVLNLNIPVWLRVIGIAVTLLIDAFLFRQSRHQFRNAHSMVAHSLADGTISTAALSDT